MPSNSGEQSEREEPTSETGEDTTEKLIKTVKCQNCGRRFVGDYCPDCGEEVDPSVTVWEVIRGFFREFSDLERGFWPTLVALTLRPGHMLREYLRGARGQFLGPGRYLLATSLLSYGIPYGFDLLSLLIYPNASNKPDKPDNPASFGFKEPKIEKTNGASDELQFETGFKIGESTDLILIITAVVAGFYIWRLFQSEIKSLGEGVALTVFAGGHVQLLTTVAAHVAVLLGAAAGVGPIEESNKKFIAWIFTLLVIVPSALAYFGACFGRCFSGWWDGIKGSVVYAWSFIEVACVLQAVATGYAAFRLWWSPSKYLPESVEVSRVSEAYPKLLILIAVVLLPALIHLGIELYYRLR